MISKEGTCQKCPQYMISVGNGIDCQIPNCDIEAGEELFDNYGDNWLDNRPGTYADFVPRSEDFSKAAAVLRKIELGMYTDLFILFMICFETT